MKTFFKNQPIWSYIGLTFAITFFFWFLPVMTALPKDIAFAAMLMGGCGPLLAGYILTVLNSGARFKIGSIPIFIGVFVGTLIILYFRLFLIEEGLNDGNGGIPRLEETGILSYLLFAFVAFVLALNISNATNPSLNENYISSFLYNKPKAKWYLLALILLPVMSLISYYLGKALDLETTDFAFNLEAAWLVSFLSTFFFFGGNEEFGWRGFLQKELQKKYNPLLTALVISFLWSLWHLPLHYNGFYTTGGFMDLLPRFIWTIPLTIVFSWLYNRSRYSILTVVILHAMLNNSSTAFGDSPWIFLSIAIILCAYCIVHDKMWKKKTYHSIYQKEKRRITKE